MTSKWKPTWKDWMDNYVNIDHNIDKLNDVAYKSLANGTLHTKHPKEVADMMDFQAERLKGISKFLRGSKTPKREKKK